MEKLPLMELARRGEKYAGLADKHYDLSQYEEAFKYQKEVVRIATVLSEEMSDIFFIGLLAESLDKLGMIFGRLGRLEEAKLTAMQALERYRILTESNPGSNKYVGKKAHAVNNLGEHFRLMGRYKQAEEMYDQALTLYELLLEKDSDDLESRVSLANTLNNYGIVSRNTEKRETAKAKYEQALSIYETLIERDPNNTMYQEGAASIFNNLGILLQDMNRPQESFSAFKMALERYQGLLKNDPYNVWYHKTVATVLENSVSPLMILERPRDAHEANGKAMVIRKTLLQSDPDNVQYQIDMARSHSSIGTAAYNIDLKKEAKSHFEKALCISEKLCDSDPDNVEYQIQLAIDRHLIGHILLDADQPAKALVFFNESLKTSSLCGSSRLHFCYHDRARCHDRLKMYKEACEDYLASIEQVEFMRHQFTFEESKLDFLMNKINVYSDTISYLCERKFSVEVIWDIVAKAKSRCLLDFLRFADLPVPKSIPEPLNKKEKFLIDFIKAKDKEARTTRHTNQVAILSQEINKLHTELMELYEEMAGFAPDYVELRKGLPLKVENILCLLNEQERKTVFVEYFVNDDAVYIFVLAIDAGGPAFEIQEISRSQISDYVFRYSREIVDFCQYSLGETWCEIADYIITPILDSIQNCEILYLVPHDFLHYLPLHALELEGKRLIEYVPIAYVSNLTQLKYSQTKHDVKSGTCLAIGYSPIEAEKKLFEGEAQMVAGLFNGDAILGARATKGLLKEKGPLGIDVLHLSCHGHFQQDEPLKSGVLLSDGMLTVSEIFNMTIKANLLVLSACQTGINEQRPGDELMGLTRAFFYSGVKSIIVSLWSVNAAATIQFMKSFYAKIKSNYSKAQALQQTQIEMIKDERFFHPYYWAPFILVGDWQ